MKNTKIIFLVSLMLLCVLFAGCDKQQDVTPASDTPSGTNATDNPIVINEIDDIAFTKLMAESKVIEKEELPEELAHVADLSTPAELYMISTIYTKSDMTKEDFDVLHDYAFLFSDDIEINISIKASKEGTPLRDYFFNSEKEVSNIDGAAVIISQYEDRYYAQFENGDYTFDVETSGMNQEQLVEIIKNIIQ